MRKISESFMQALTTGFLTGITQKVIEDSDLDLQIRDNYLNIYFKGNSLLKLSEVDGQRYVVEIHTKFLGGMEIPDFVDDQTTKAFLGKVPDLKENIIRYGKSSLEIEYEQLIIRANNNERRNNSEFFIIDRQSTTPKRERFDLTGIYWSRNKRRKGQIVPLCLMEIKFALNTDIGEVHKQLTRYYESLQNQIGDIAEESEIVFRQKLELGLFDQPDNRVEAMKTLQISKDFKDVQFVLILVDYNPYSKLLDLSSLRDLPFANQVKIFYSGFGMWGNKLEAG